MLEESAKGRCSSRSALCSALFFLVRFVGPAVILTNPIISVASHVAFIAPGFALGEVTPATVGVHEFKGKGRWQSWFGQDAATRIHLA